MTAPQLATPGAAAAPAVAVLSRSAVAEPVPVEAAASRHLLHVFPSFRPGGVEIRTLDLIRAFAAEADAGARPLRHSLLSLDGSSDARERLPAACRPALVAPPPRAGTLATARSLRRLFAAARPDAVLTYNWGAFDAVLAAATSRAGSGRLARRLVHHEDGFNADESGGLKLRRILARRLVLPRARLVIVPSERLRRLAVERWGVPATRVRRIVNGVRGEAFQTADRNRRLRQELGIPLRAPLVGSVGALRPEKRFDRLLAAVAALSPAIHLLLVGDGPERGALEARARELGVAGRVVFAGWQEDPAPFYRALDAYAIPSDTEQLPVSLLEAMASGLAVAATDVGDLRATLPREQGGLLVPLGPAAENDLAFAIARLLGDRELAARLGAANRARALADYSFAGMCAAYRECYEAACDG